MIKGFIIGKFMPLTKGHEALIEFGLANCDELTVMLGAEINEPIDYVKRMLWLMRKYSYVKKINLVLDVVTPPSLDYDNLSKWWGKRIKSRYGVYDILFSSEKYGEVLAETMGAKNMIFDIHRKTVPVSATMIRENPVTNWDFISVQSKPDSVKTICIVGTESTGKTVLCQKLADHYNTNWSKEIGRDLILDTNKCTINDLQLVGYEHLNEIHRQKETANKILFVDTDIYITKSYSNFLLGDIPKWPYWAYESSDMDLRIFLKSDAPYVNDGTRLNKEDRLLLEKSHLKTYEDAGIFPKVFSYNGSYDKRFEDIVYYIDTFLTNL